MELFDLLLHTKSDVGELEWYVFCRLAADSLYSTNKVVTKNREVGQLVSALRPSVVAEDLNLELEQVVEAVKKLRRWGWVQDVRGYWGMGSTDKGYPSWHAVATLSKRKYDKTPKVMTTEDKIRQALELRSAKQEKEKILANAELSRQHALKLIKKQRNKTPGQRLMAKAADLHWEVFGSKYELKKNEGGKRSFPMELKLYNNLLGYFRNDERQAKVFMEWVYRDWETVKKQVGWRVPTASLFGTKEIVVKLRKLQKGGETSHRFKDDASPDVGF